MTNNTHLETTSNHQHMFIQPPRHCPHQPMKTKPNKTANQHLTISPVFIIGQQLYTTHKAMKTSPSPANINYLNLHQRETVPSVLSSPPTPQPILLHDKPTMFIHLPMKQTPKTHIQFHITCFRKPQDSPTHKTPTVQETTTLNPEPRKSRLEFTTCSHIYLVWGVNSTLHPMPNPSRQQFKATTKTNYTNRHHNGQMNKLCFDEKTYLDCIHSIQNIISELNHVNSRQYKNTLTKTPTSAQFTFTVIVPN